MALPLAGRQITIEVVGELISKPYVDITLNLMARFGVTMQRDGWSSFSIPAGSRLMSPGEVFVEGDASGASYFLAAGAIGGGPVRVEGVGRGSIQGDVGFADALARMGARIDMGENWIEAAAPANGETARLRPGFELDSRCGHDAGGGGAVRRRHQPAAQYRQLAREGNRPHRGDGDGIAQARRTCGGGPGFSDGNPASASRLTPDAAIDTYDDHRIAMCFSLAALGGVNVRINDPGCVAKTFPDYFERFAEVTSTVRGPRHCHRRPVGFRKRCGSAASGRASRISLSRQRIAFTGWLRWRRCATGSM